MFGTYQHFAAVQAVVEAMSKRLGPSLAVLKNAGSPSIRIWGWDHSKTSKPRLVYLVVPIGGTLG